MRGSRLIKSTIFSKSRQHSMKMTRDSYLFPLRSPTVVITNNSSNCENMVERKTQETAQLEFAVLFSSLTTHICYVSVRDIPYHWEVN